MSNQHSDITIEIYSDLPQQELWNTEEELRQVEGVKEVDLQESKGFESLDPQMVAAAIFISLNVVEQSLNVTGRIQKMAQILYNLTHSKTGQEQRKVTITKKDGTKIELQGLSDKQIEKLLAD